MKNKDICEVFENLGNFCSAEAAISYFYEREKKSLSPVECDMIRYEMDLNYILNNDVSEYSFEYNYPVQKIYKKFKQNKDNYLEWEKENEIPTKIVSKK